MQGYSIFAAENTATWVKNKKKSSRRLSSQEETIVLNLKVETPSMKAALFSKPPRAPYLIKTGLLGHPLGLNQFHIFTCIAKALKLHLFGKKSRFSKETCNVDFTLTNPTSQ